MQTERHPASTGLELAAATTASGSAALASVSLATLDLTHFIQVIATFDTATDTIALMARDVDGITVSHSAVSTGALGLGTVNGMSLFAGGNGNYSNAGWDLVDALREKKINPAKLDANELPEEMRDLAPAARKDYIQKAAASSDKIQEEIKQLNEEREKFVAGKLKDSAEGGGKTLDQAMIEATRKQAESLGYKFEK